MQIMSPNKWCSALFAGVVLLGVGFSAQAYDQTSNSHQIDVQSYTTAELEQLLAPIALYPDSLLTHILIASTYPLEVIEANRWRERFDYLDVDELEEKSQNKDWDPSVKALLAFPTVLEKLSDELNWMQQLGDAFLEDEARVLASIQSLRQKADEAGNLSQMDNVNVIREQKTIIIEPARTEVVYVPYYDTRVVYGRWHWAHHPPIYWHQPHYYTYYNGPFSWHSGVHISVGFYFGAFHWHKRHVVINHHHNRWHHPRRKIVTSHHAKKWVHAPNRRRGVAYRSEVVARKYHSNKVSTSRVKSIRHNKNKAIKVVTHSSSNKKQYREHPTRRNTTHAKIVKGNHHNRVVHSLKRNEAVKVTRHRQHANSHDNVIKTSERRRDSALNKKSSQHVIKNKQYHKTQSTQTRKTQTHHSKVKHQKSKEKVRHTRKTTTYAKNSSTRKSSSSSSQRARKHH